MITKKSLLKRIEDLEERVSGLKLQNTKMDSAITALECNLFIHAHPPLFKKGQCVVVIFSDIRKEGKITQDAILSISPNPHWLYPVLLDDNKVIPTINTYEETKLFLADPEPESEEK